LAIEILDLHSCSEDAPADVIKPVIQNLKCDIKRRKVTNITNPKPLQGSFHSFHKYLGFGISFRSDNPNHLDTGYVYVLGSESCSERLSMCENV